MTDKKQVTGAELLNAPEFQELKKYAQIMPKEMLDKMKQNAEEHNVSLEVEMASLLLASFVEAKSLGVDTLLQHILNREFTEKEAVAECKRRRQDWQYLYEVKKLHLFLEMKENLPRKFKETFSLIDVNEETKRFWEEQRKAHRRGN